MKDKNNNERYSDNCDKIIQEVFLIKRRNI